VNRRKPRITLARGGACVVCRYVELYSGVVDEY
jgi:hypothetical protein